MSRVEIKDELCPYCNGTEFIEAKHSGYGALVSCESEWLGAALYHVICRRCGSVVRSYVKDPEKLLKKKNRKNA